MTDISISKFFTALSERAYKENDLSDVTYAMCEADECFKICFLQFFFGKEFDVHSVNKFQREHSVDDSRPDFWIETLNGLYLVEVKINDGSHHFKSYLSILENQNVSLSLEENKKRLGYIAAYEIMADEEGNPIDRSLVRIWADFKKELESRLPDDPLVKGYLEYLSKLVCGECVDEEWNLDLNEFNLIGNNDFSLHEAIVNMKIGKEYKTSASYNPMFRKGFYLDCVEIDGCPQCPFIGTYFGGKDSQLFCVGFECAEKWGDVVCSKYNDIMANGEFVKMESEGLFIYPQVKVGGRTFKAVFEDILNACRDRDKNNLKLLNLKELSIEGIDAPYRSIRNLFLTLRKLFEKNGLVHYPHPDSRKNRYLHYGEWCTLKTTKAGRPDGLLFLWFGVRYDSKEKKARLVCEIRKEDNWNLECHIEGNGWNEKVTDEAKWSLISKSAEENVGLEDFIQSIVNEVSNDRTSL